MDITKRFSLLMIIFMIVISGFVLGVPRDKYTSCIDDGTIMSCSYDSTMQNINKNMQSSNYMDYDYEVVTGEYQAYFKSNPTQGQVVKFIYDNTEIDFQPMAMNYRNDLNQLQQIEMINSVVGSPDGNEFVYSDAYGVGVDLKYIYNGNNLKELLVINDVSGLTPPAQYILDGGNPTLDIDFIIHADTKIFINNVEWDKKNDITTTNEVYITNANDEEVYYLPKPYAYDSAGAKQEASYKFKSSGNSLYIIKRTPYSWIIDENRVLPIYIDPSVVLNETNDEMNLSVDNGYYQDMYVTDLKLKLTSNEDLVVNSTLEDKGGGVVKHKFYLTNPNGYNVTYNLSLINEIDWNTLSWGTKKINIADYSVASPFVITHTLDETEKMYVIRQDGELAAYRWKDISSYIQSVDIYTDGGKNYIELKLSVNVRPNQTLELDPTYEGNNCTEIQNNLNNGYDTLLNGSVTCELDVSNSSTSYINGSGYLLTGGIKVMVPDIEIVNINITTGYMVDTGVNGDGITNGDHYYGIWSNLTQTNTTVTGCNIYSIIGGDGYSGNPDNIGGSPGLSYSIYFVGGNNTINDNTIYYIVGGAGGASDRTGYCTAGGSVYNIWLNKSQNIISNNIIDQTIGGVGGPPAYNADGCSGGSVYVIYAYNSSDNYVYNNWINYTKGGAGSSTVDDESGGAGGHVYGIYFRYGENNDIIDNTLITLETGFPGNGQSSSDGPCGLVQGINTGSFSNASGNILTNLLHLQRSGGDTSRGYDGYGIYFDSANNITATDNIITDMKFTCQDQYLSPNAGDGDAYGIYLYNESSSTFTNNQFENITASDRGVEWAIYPYNLTSMQPDVPVGRDTTFYHTLIWYVNGNQTTGVDLSFGPSSNPDQLNIGTNLSIGTYCTNVRCEYNWTINHQWDETYFEVQENGGTVYDESDSYLDLVAVAPVTESVTLLPTSAYTTENVSGYCNVSDANGGNLTYYWETFRNTTSYSSGSVSDVPEGTNYNVVTITSAETTVGENWTLSCRGYDSVYYSVLTNSTDSYINPGVPPIINQSLILPTTPETNENLTGWCNATDVDGGNLEYVFNWYVNGVLNKTGTTNSSFAEGTLVNVDNLSYQYTTKGENWTLGCQAYDYVGYSVELNSTLVTIQNTLPDMESSRIEPVVAYSNDTLVLYCNGSDLNTADQHTYYYRVYNNSIEYTSGSVGTYLQGTEVNVDNVSSSIIKNGEQWMLGCLVADDEGNSSWLNSSVLNIQVTPPGVEQLYATPIYPRNSDDLDCNFNITSLDVIDEINVSVTWYTSADNVTFNSITDYDYNYTNITLDTLYTTTIGTGSVSNVDVSDYSHWKCSIDVLGGGYLVEDNSTQIDVYPLENLILYSPANNTAVSPPLNAFFQVTDWRNNITCSLNIFKDVCYQETANVSNICGGLDNGSYSFTTGSTAYMYVNYTKPGGVTQDTYWTVKHGTLSTYNITLPNSCWAQQPLRLRISSGRLIQSQPACYNGTTWENVGQAGTGGTCSGYPTTTSSVLYDGDWSTTALWNQLAAQWENMGSDNCSGKVYEEAIGWATTDTTTRYDLLNGTTYNISYYTQTEGSYNWNVSCDSLGPNPTLTSETRVFISDGTPPTFSNYFNDTSLTHPNIDDVVELSVLVTEQNLIDSCILQINDNGSWFDDSVYNVNLPTTTVSMNFTVRDVSTSENVNVSWRTWCNDSSGNNATSASRIFTVVDTTTPIVVIGSGNTFSENNRTIISSGLYDLDINVTFVDYNLFQALINITCDTNGTIYYWEELNITNGTYNKVDTIQLDGMLPQECQVYISASDDHTLEEIEDYETDITRTGLIFETTEGLTVEVYSKESASEIDDVDTEKMVDRKTFEFDYDNKKLIRDLTVKTDGELYNRKSQYNGHFVAWNPNTHTGNWIDFVVKSDLNLKYQLSRVNDNEYNIRVISVVPNNPELKPKRTCFIPIICGWMTEEELINYYYGIDKLSFESIGGTNIFNATYLFYTGGQVNLSTLNVYDNGTYIDDWTVGITTINSYPGFNGTFVVNATTEIAENLTNGTYWFNFSHANYFSRGYVVNIQNISQAQVYSTWQAQANIILRNVKTLTALTNGNVSILNLNNGLNNSIYNNDSVTTVSVFYINASGYNLTAQHVDYNQRNTSFSIGYKENTTIYVDMYFDANFILYDERTSELFNVSSADRINFLLFCPDSTYTTLINETTPTIPIICAYDKFKFVLDYGTTSYYRTYILEPEDVFNVSIYLIDLTTTQSIYNSLSVDDLLSDYDNPSIFVKKVINDETVIITSDYVDVENKIGAYLIENHEYSIEIHSDNKPIRILGPYSADIAGDKSLRLYDISLGPTGLGNINSVSSSIGKQNLSGTEHIVAYYNDMENRTEYVTFNVYAGTYGSTVYTTTVVGNESMIFTYNMSAISNQSVWGELVVQHEVAGTQTATKLVNEETRVSLGGLTDYVSQEFLNWFLTLLLGVVAIMSTIKSANYASFAMIGLAALFVMFGWYGLSWSVLVFAALVALLTLLKQGDKNMS